MDEISLQLFILKNFIYFGEMMTTQRERVEIIDIGEINYNEGPDFINAHIILNDIHWFGNIEVHIKSSEWDKHKHSCNEFYNSVILHIVLDQDKQIFKKDHTPLPTVEINKFLKSFPDDIFQIKNILEKKNFDIKTLENLFPILLMQRMKRKNNFILDLLKKLNGDWDNTAFHLLMYNFGFKVNNEQMLQLASSLSYKVIQKNKDDERNLLALLAGQAGLLNKFNDNFSHCYNFLQQKYCLKKEKILWRYARIHPQNFPEVRIQQIAKIIYKKNSLLEWVCDNDCVFEKNFLTKRTQNHIKINVVIPLHFAYENYYGRATKHILERFKEIESEDNHIVRRWKKRGINIHNSYESQALLELERI